jgi:hypothetical protein
MTIFGGVFAGPALSTWYRLIDKKVTATNKFQNLATKVVLDQFVFAPFFIAAFFTVQGLFEGKSVTEIKDKLSSGYTTALIGNYKVKRMKEKKVKKKKIVIVIMEMYIDLASSSGCQFLFYTIKL